MNFERSKQKAPKESNNDVKVTGKGDIISVTGVNSGKNIKVYNRYSGAEVKSVIAQDDVVNIRLPKSQSYVIQAGNKRFKVVL